MSRTWLALAFGFATLCAAFAQDKPEQDTSSYKGGAQVYVLHLQRQVIHERCRDLRAQGRRSEVRGRQLGRGDQHLRQRS